MEYTWNTHDTWRIRSLEASSTPAVIIARALTNKGWTTGQAAALHTATSKTVMDIGGPERKSYWQCLLELPRLLERGVEGVRSGQHPSYYTALRTTRSPSLVLPDMKVAYYTAIVQGASPVDASLGCAPSNIGSGHAEDGDDEDIIWVSASAGSSRHGQERAGTHGQERSSTATPPGNIAEDSEDDLMYTSAPTGHVPHVALTGIPEITLLQDEHLKPGQVGHYRRVAVMCPLCDSKHKRDNPCKKYRNVGAKQTELGPQEPVAYLAVWAANAGRFTTAAQHIAFRPSPADVKAYMLSRGWLSE